ncbi:polyunsaturated fatty acid lipoxygenase ALOX8-like isoform X1 [Ostrea edulis]|uniref:polyunsaturated fatty acid lipoxygenase ALOX8-like isoform X1 n=1 Tax=Ostrea edulis TaxID=37623 RepID=UPI0024AF107B|nr:polyunsaturated fatty acid lipoxygenase ALOX8-like isoform X1 [Ostrea edulis]
MVQLIFYRFYEVIFGRGRWTIYQMIDHFTSSYVLKEPKGCRVWRAESVNKANQTATQKAQADHWFAWQILNGLTRNLIRRATEIPKQFVPFVELVEADHPYLNGLSLKQHIQNDTLFVVDLVDVSFDEATLLAPIALFVVNNDLLMPVAIRIDPRNPNLKEVSTPPPNESDRPEQLRKWVKARMWFNMLDAQYHESVTHLGFTHMLMDGVSVCLHRNLSERHPIYKLMLPHFRYMHFNNERAIKIIPKVAEKDMYFGRKNMMKLIARHNEIWTFDEHACIDINLRKRGVMDLPGYFFKEDALQLQEAIRNFVHEYVTNYYGVNQEVVKDQEIQSFRTELMAPRSISGDGGCGMMGVPEFDGIGNLVTVLTNFIYICSVEHSATNFPQYEEYAFPPNKSLTLIGQPELQTGDDELDIAMPTGRQLFLTIKFMAVSNTVLTNSLGNYESEYLDAMDSAGQRIVQNFQKKLVQIENNINQRNEALEKSVDRIQEYPYHWLLPNKVLNSISA